MLIRMRGMKNMVKCNCDGSCMLCDDDGMLHIVDEEYDPGVPGRACLDCNSAWPTSEPGDHIAMHHSHGCAQVQS